MVTISLNRLSILHIPSWYITFFTVLYFLLILGIPDNDRKINLEISYSFFSFSSNSLRYHDWIVKSMGKIFKELELPTKVGQQKKNLISRISKMPSSCKIHLFEKVKQEGKTQGNTQSMINSFRKIQSCKISLQLEGGNFDNL